MGFVNGNINLTRFKITDPVPEDLWPKIPDKLKLFAFQDIDALPEERSWGWTNIDDMLDSSWSSSTPEKAQYLTFSLRLDTRRVSPAVLKKHRILALREEAQKIEREGRKIIPNSRKKELFEVVRHELLMRSLPIPAEFNVVWNTQNNIVYFASTQNKMINLFSELFSKTFDLDLEQLTPYVLAVNFLGDDFTSKLDNLQLTSFI